MLPSVHVVCFLFADAGPSSVVIPASPFMQKLGYGTGVNVYLMRRYGHGQDPCWDVGFCLLFCFFQKGFLLSCLCR